MSISVNLLMILIGVNLLLFVFGNPINNSPILAIIKNIFDIASGTGSWSNFFSSYATLSTITIFGVLISILAIASIATGSNYLTTGGGYGAVSALQILAISIFIPMLLMPNFATFGFPSIIEYILDIIFGGWIVVTIITILKGL
ncbi:MAG: hypothetical protein QW303_06440 [Nitrososphaerota archaeon]